MCWQVKLDSADRTFTVGSGATASTVTRKDVTNVRITYFDTLPTAVSLCISKFGMLFAASEFSNQ